MFTKHCWRIYFAVFTFGLSACAAIGQTPLSQQIANAKPAVNPSANADEAKGKDGDRPQLTQRNLRYRINRSDVLNLSFPLSPEFNQTVTVQPDGYITLQGAGSICILGMTVPETGVAIKKAYASILHEPIVDVDLKDFQKAYFIVTGQVTKPGQYDLRYDLTASEAIAVAGGFLPTAKTRVYLYHRSTEGWVQARELKLKDVLHGKNIAEDVEIHPGDMIFVPEKTITKVRKYIPYGVGVPLSTSPVSY
ncbi:MAG TPA: polysaccharide biosynthesis/export family protein [Candidatus Acidoferrum sp.]|nr:polysaccharide biosynthesis/export family protein [Candidatus Acidoferrum sp.]